MPVLAREIVTLLATFAPAFTACTFATALVLLYGTLLAVGPRTVVAALAVRGHLRDRWNDHASVAAPDVIHIPRPRWDSLTELLCDAA